MASPSNREKELPYNAISNQIPKKAAVLLYCYPKNDIMHLSLIKRTNYLGVHSGQISFPGGKYESEDKSLEKTAIRECFEELGTIIKTSNILTPLTPLYIPPSNFLVNPFVGHDNFYPKFSINSREVASLIEIPLFKLLELKIKQKKLKKGPLKGIKVPCFIYQNHLIWGATAMILSEFKFFLASLRSN